MKVTEKEVASRAEDALRACLDGIPFVKLKRPAKKTMGTGLRPDSVDLAVEVKTDRGITTLVVEIKTSGQPRIARQAVNQLLRYIEGNQNVYGLFLAPYVSPRSAAICEEAGIGYLDLSGNCKISFDRVYIERQGMPNRYSAVRELRSLYSPKATRILRVLLSHPKRVWKVADLAKEASVSLGQVFNVKRRLEDREWGRAMKHGFVLEKPMELLEEWSDNHSLRRSESCKFYSTKSIGDIEADLAQAGVRGGFRCALTGFSAAARMAPGVRYQRAMAYTDAVPEQLASGLGFKPVPSGDNVVLLSPYDEGVYYAARDFGGILTVSPVQAYLDLRGYRGRGEEAAAEVLERVIKPQW